MFILIGQNLGFWWCNLRLEQGWFHLKPRTSWTGKKKFIYNIFLWSTKIIIKIFLNPTEISLNMIFLTISWHFQMQKEANKKPIWSKIWKEKKIFNQLNNKANLDLNKFEISQTNGRWVDQWLLGCIYWKRCSL